MSSSKPGPASNVEVAGGPVRPSGRRLLSPRGRLFRTVVMDLTTNFGSLGSVHSRSFHSSRPFVSTCFWGGFSWRYLTASSIRWSAGLVTAGPSESANPSQSTLTPSRLREEANPALLSANSARAKSMKKSATRSRSMRAGENKCAGINRIKQSWKDFPCIVGTLHFARDPSSADRSAESDPSISPQTVTARGRLRYRSGVEAVATKDWVRSPCPWYPPVTLIIS